MITYDIEGMTTGGIVVVTGSRSLVRPDHGTVRRTLAAADPRVLYHGGAVGVDTYAGMWCKGQGVIETVVHPVTGSDYETIRARLLERNRRMVRRAKSQARSENLPLCVLAFPTPASSGTWYTAKYADRCGLDVRVVRIGLGGE